MRGAVNRPSRHCDVAFGAGVFKKRDVALTTLHDSPCQADGSLVPSLHSIVGSKIMLRYVDW